MIDFDVEPGRRAFASHHVAPLIHGPENSDLGLLIAHQEAGQRARSPRLDEIGIEARGWVPRNLLGAAG